MLERFLEVICGNANGSDRTHNRHQQQHVHVSLVASDRLHLFPSGVIRVLLDLLCG